MRAIAAVLLLLLCGTAHAEPVTRTEISIPLTIGGLNDDTGWHFAIGWHPELIVARVDEGSYKGWGVGGFADLTAAGPTGRAAAGATAVFYGDLGRTIALSGGISTSGGHGAVPFVGLFAGWRLATEFHIDVPLGVRVDVRPAAEARTAVSISFEDDAVADLYLLYQAFKAIAHMD